jgi:hypothetical protein
LIFGWCEKPLVMVRKERLELSRLAALEPKSSASTNSATFALSASSFWPIITSGRHKKFNQADDGKAETGEKAEFI